MRVSLTESGGWTGLVSKRELDTTELSRAQARMVEETVARIAHGKMRVFFGGHPNAPAYVIVLETKDGPVEVRFDERALASTSLLKVVELLRHGGKVSRVR